MTSRHLTRWIVLVVAGLAAVPTTIAAAARPAIGCGDTITQDTRLTANLVDCPGAGLVIGADAITLDLNGHTVDGDGTRDDGDIGIDVSGHRAVTITHGAVAQFTEGVLVSGASGVALRGLTSSDEAHGGITVQRSSAVTIAGNVVRGAGAGIIVGASDAVLVSDNRVSASTFGGIALFGSRHVRITDNTVTGSSTDAAVGLFDGSSDNEVSANRLSRSGAGIALNNDAARNLIAANTIGHNDSGVIVDAGTHDNRVLGNAVEDSAFEGIAVVGSDRNVVAANRVARNGALDEAGGIVLIALPDDPAQTSDANTLSDNVALDNGGDGIHVEGGQPANLLRANQADRNTRLGIDADGAIDGGANRAARNGDARQCLGVSCAI
jgi:parallel beta-helix repeat protein